MSLILTRLTLAGSLIGAIALVWCMTPTERHAHPLEPVVLPATAGSEPVTPQPVATSPATLAATLRASQSPPSPDHLRDNPQAQAAYDATAKPGDFVTPPSVSVEH